MKEMYFYGNKVSHYGIENGYVDYETFAKALRNIVLCNNIIEATGYDKWELHNDFVNSDIRPIYQWYIVENTSWNQELLEEYGECWAYDDEDDLLIWGVDHLGTAWDYVLTNIKLIKDGEENEKCRI